MNDLNQVQPLDEFDWDSYEGGGVKAEQTKEEQEKAYGNTLNQITEHEVVEGTVNAINKREVLVDIGYKSDGVSSANEFRYNPDLKPVDKVEVYIEKEEDKKGQLILSHKKARAKQGGDRVNQALESKEVVKGLVKARAKGGM